MARTITLAVDVPVPADRVIAALATTEGQRGFWTADCDLTADSGRFGFPQAPVDLHTRVTVEAGKLVRMTVTAGFPFWEGSTWEWEVTEPRSGSGTGVLFRHHGFQDGYPESDLGYTAQTWALIMDRLVSYLTTGAPTPLFPAP